MTGRWSGEAMVHRARGTWRRAELLVEVLGLGVHDVLTIMRLVEAGIGDGVPVERIVEQVRRHGLNPGPRTTASVVVAVALSAAADRDDAVPEAPAVVA